MTNTDSFTQTELRGKRYSSASPFVRVAAKNLLEQYVPAEKWRKVLGKEVCQLQKKFRAAPYPFDGLVSEEEHRRLMQVVSDKKFCWRISTRSQCSCMSGYFGFDKIVKTKKQKNNLLKKDEVCPVCCCRDIINATAVEVTGMNEKSLVFKLG